MDISPSSICIFENLTLPNTSLLVEPYTYCASLDRYFYYYDKLYSFETKELFDWKKEVKCIFSPTDKKICCNVRVFVTCPVLLEIK